MSRPSPRVQRFQGHRKLAQQREHLRKYRFLSRVTNPANGQPVTVYITREADHVAA